MTKRRKFTPEFKREAVRLLESGDRSGAAIARELGIQRNRLYKWQEEIQKHGDNAFPGLGKRTRQSDQAEEIARLKRELAAAREEAAILKKAAAFFARELT